MVALITPQRFELSEEQLAAALTLGNTTPAEWSGVVSVPPPADPAAALAGAGLGESGVLTPDASAMLRKLAAPDRMLSVLANSAGSPTWVEWNIVAQGEGPYVARSTPERRWDLSMVPTATQATVLLDGLLGITALVADPGDQRFTLDLGSYVALLVASDALQMARLEARLARSRQPEPLLTVGALQRQLELGLQHEDTRWAATAARLIAPLPLGTAAGKLDSGCGSLVDQGVLTRSEGGYRFTQDGYTVARDFRVLTTSAGLRLSLVRDGRWQSVAQFNLFRAATAIWVAAWVAAQGESAEVRLWQLGTSGALGLIRDLLEQRPGG